MNSLRLFLVGCPCWLSLLGFLQGVLERVTCMVPCRIAAFLVGVCLLVFVGGVVAEHVCFLVWCLCSLCVFSPCGPLFRRPLSNSSGVLNICMCKCIGIHVWRCMHGCICVCYVHAHTCIAIVACLFAWFIDVSIHIYTCVHMHIFLHNVKVYAYVQGQRDT